MITPAELTVENYRSGVMTGPQHIAGVTALDNDFVAFCTEVETGEAVAFFSSPSLQEALAKIQLWAAVWHLDHFEGFGCSKGASCTGAQKGRCPSCDNRTAAETAACC